MSDMPDRRTRSGWAWLITMLILVLAGVTVFSVSRPSHRTAAPQPVGVSGRPEAPATPAAAATSAATRAPTVPTRGAGGAVAADVPGPDSHPGLLVPGLSAATAGESAGSCAHWRTSLSDEQRTSYAVASLRGAWQNEGSAGNPPPSAVRAYSSGIATACAGRGRADDNVADVARVVYAAGRSAWGP